MRPAPEMKLRAVPLAEVLPLGSLPGVLYVTMAPGQWDALLAGAYADGWVLLEVDTDGIPARAYRREPVKPVDRPVDPPDGAEVNS